MRELVSVPEGTTFRVQIGGSWFLAVIRDGELILLRRDPETTKKKASR